MKCAACDAETGKRVASYFCPHCGAPMEWAVRWKKAGRRELRREVDEKLARQPVEATPARGKPPAQSALSGALLTGNADGDFWFGAANEPVAVALAAFGVYQLLFVATDQYVLSVLAQIATGAFMLWHGARMRERFPTVASGFRRWRGITGGCFDQLKTLLCGAGVAAVLFPLAAFMLLFVRIIGAVGWVPVLVVLYGFGFVVRRIHDNKMVQKKRRVPYG